MGRYAGRRAVPVWSALTLFSHQVRWIAGIWLLAAATCWGQCGPGPLQVFPSAELDGPARGAAMFDDGSGPAMYIYGHFTRAGGAPAHGVARFDGKNCWALGPGIQAPDNCPLEI